MMFQSNRRPARALTTPKTVTLVRRVVVIVPPPTGEYPVTLDQVKKYLGIGSRTDLDDLLNDMIAAATEQVEAWLRRALITRTYLQTTDTLFSLVDQNSLPDWEGTIQAPASIFFDRAHELWYPPLISVISIKYYDRDGTINTMDPNSYYVDASSPDNLGRVVLKDSVTPPQNTRDANAFEIEYSAGYGADSTFIPVGIQQGMLRLISYLFVSRGCADSCAKGGAAGIPDPIIDSGAAGFLQPYRIERLCT